MKNLFKTMVILIIALIFPLSTNAQEDKISGIYVDGVKVTEIDCYSFGEMWYIFPIDKLKGFDMVAIGLDIYTNDKQTLVAQKETKYSNLILHSFQYNGMLYSKFKIFEKGQSWSDLTIDPDPYKYLKRNQFYVKNNSSDKQHSIAYCVPKNIESYEEKYDSFCSCIKKTPIYGRGEAAFLAQITMKPNTNGNKEPKQPTTFKEKYLKPIEELSVDLSLACPVKGLKLDDLMISETKSQINNSGSSSTIGLKIVTEKHKNGKVKVQGQNNKEGNQEGTWKYFNELGKLERVENYKNGISHGEWKFYDTKTGKISKTEKYNEGELME
jgi:hypothetical protein